MRQQIFRQILVVALLFFGVLTGMAQAQATRGIYSLQVDGLACPFCAYGIEKRLSAVKDVVAVEIDIASGTVTVALRPGATLDEETAGKAVRAAGFTMRNFSAKRGSR